MENLQHSTLWETVKNIDFSMVINKMVSHEGWRKSEAEEACELYRHFLYLSAKYPDKKLPPSDDIDDFWHNHILDTRQYREDCQNVFGYYLDHYPYVGMDGETTSSDVVDGFEETQRLHKEEFGDFIYEVRVKSVFRNLMKIIERRKL